MYEKSAELFYAMIANRIRMLRDFLGLKNYEIYAEDANLISAIIHNRKHPQKNKYLIPADTTRGDFPKEYVKTIAEKLKISPENELLSGSYAEVVAYSGNLFYMLITEALNFEPDYSVKKREATQEERAETTARITKVLMDYIPFAIGSFYLDATDKHPETINYLVDTKFVITIDEFMEVMRMAIARLYSKIELEFYSLVYNLFAEKPNTYKLPKRLEEMVKEQLLPLIESALAERSLGNEAYSILNHSFERMNYLLNYELSLSPEKIGYHENDHIYVERHVIHELAKADSEYVDRLAHIQQEIEDEPNLELLADKWSPDMCI